MPGHDGTGPRGRGPMTGRGEGYCALKVADTSEELLAGFAGVSGRSVAVAPEATRADVDLLREEVRHVREALLALECDIARLEARRQGSGDTRHLTGVGGDEGVSAGGVR